MPGLIDKIVRKRTEKIVGLFEESIKEGDRVLDIGPGGGWISKELIKRRKVEITLLDVKDFNHTDLKLVIYDGKNIPFPESSFDVALLIFMLHHCSDLAKVLKEAKRVSRNKIIVIEDVPNSFLNKIFLWLWDIATNLPSLIKPPGEDITFNFKTISQWDKIFNELRLKVVSQKEFQSNKFIHHQLFVLQVC